MTQVREDVPPTPEVDPDLAAPQRRQVGELIETEVEQPEEEVVELTEQERDDFSTLMNIGRRSKKINVMGHDVVVQTLKTADEMRIALYTKKYKDTQIGFQRSYQVAVCAAGVREIDNRPVFTSLSAVTSEDEIFDKTVEKLAEFYPVVITTIYQAIMDLEKEFIELAIKLGKLKG